MAHANSPSAQWQWWKGGNINVAWWQGQAPWWQCPCRGFRGRISRDDWRTYYRQASVRSGVLPGLRYLSYVDAIIQIKGDPADFLKLSVAAILALKAWFIKLGILVKIAHPRARAVEEATARACPLQRRLTDRAICLIFHLLYLDVFP